MSDNKDILVGFIGQGWIGKNYANNYEKRGYNTVRYSLEEEYISNKQNIKKCDIVIIAVPTPTPKQKFDASIVEDVVSLVGKGKTAVIKSTVLPGTTDKIQQKYPDIFLMHSPEFLTEATAEYDTANPEMNIVGVPVKNNDYLEKAQIVIDTFPSAPFQKICFARESELSKYISNTLPFIKIVYLNMIYDLCEQLGCEYSVLKETMEANPFIANSHLDPIHKKGRGAGGDCLIKDFAAFSRFLKQEIDDKFGIKMLEAAERRNIELLLGTDKDLDKLKQVFGKDIVNQRNQ